VHGTFTRASARTSGIGLSMLGSTAAVAVAARLSGITTLAVNAAEGA
jgi:hypothetical protein